MASFVRIVGTFGDKRSILVSKLIYNYYSLIAICLYIKASTMLAKMSRELIELCEIEPVHLIVLKNI